MSPSNANAKGANSPAAPPQHQHTQSSTSTAPFLPADGTSKRYAGQAPLRTSSNPRNVQHQRKPNRSHRRPRLQEDEDTLAEHNAIRTVGSRRGQTSITHLMSFALPPRPYTHYGHSGHHLRRNTAWGVGSGHHPSNKSRYIHANYRFIVDPRGDYRTQLADSDVHHDWTHILQVLATFTEDTSCPICLSTPVAPRMAKCGHIFCLPCSIRYLHSSNEDGPGPEKKRRWKPCPICFDTLFLHELKPVRWTHNEHLEEPKEDHDVVLRLLRRKMDSTLALPRETAECSFSSQEVPWHFVPEVFEYAHFMKGSESYMQEQYSQEIEALRAQEREDEVLFGEETVWYRKAATSVQELRDKIQGIGGPLLGQSSDAVSPAEANAIDDLASFYFYQAPVHSYLCPLDIRILKATFGDFSMFPSTILPRVEHISTGNIMDEEMRKRAKYLSHLPLGCEISFLECDWTDIVPHTVLETFANELEKRRRRNQEKSAREEKARVRAEQSEDKKLYGTRRMRSFLSKDAEWEGQSVTDALVLSSSADLTAPSSSPLWGSPTARQTSSFASLASPSTSPSAPAPVTVWGTPAIASTSPQQSSTQQSSSLKMPESEPEDDGWLQNWEEDYYEDGLTVGTQRLGISGEAGPPTAAAPGDISKKRKKKTKITLMSTNGRRAA